MRWPVDGSLAAIFNGDKGAFFTVVLVGLLIAGVILLVINLSARPRPPAAPKWEPVADEPEPTPRPATATPVRAQPTKPPAPRRRP